MQILRPYNSAVDLNRFMGVRHVPDLAFLADRSGRFQKRIEELMDRSRKRNKYAPVAESAPVEAPAAAPGQPETASNQ